MKKEVEFNLSKPIKYSKDGDYLEESVLIMVSPSTQSSNVRRKARTLRNLSLVAIRQAEASAPKNVDAEPVQEESEEISGKDLMALLAVGGFDTEKLITAMRDLAPHVVSIGDTGVEFKSGLWEKLSMEDEEGLTGAYISNFLLVSDTSEK